MKKHFSTYLSLLILTSAIPSFAQLKEIAIGPFQVQGQGQPHAQVIFEDSRGFIWLGRYDGLYKYDGYSLLRYSHDPTDSVSLSDNDIKTIAEDKDGFLWIGTSHGLNKFNPANGACERFYCEPDSVTSLSDNFITTVFVDQFNVIWAGTHDSGLNSIYKSKSGVVQYYHCQRYQHNPDHSNSISSDEIYAISEDLPYHGNRLWIGTANGLDALERQSGLFTHFKHDPLDKTTISDNKVWSLYRDTDGELWIGTGGGGLNRLNRSNGSGITFSSFRWGQNSQIQTIAGDQSNNLWIGTLKHDLFIYNKKTGDYRRIRHDLESRNSFRSPIIYSIVADKANIVWISCQSGIFQYDPQKEKCRQYAVGSGIPWTAGYRRINAIYEQNDSTLWIGAWKEGLVKFDVPNEKFRVFKNPDEQFIKMSPWINSITPDHHGQLWIGSNYGLMLFDPTSEQVQCFQANPDDPDDPYHPGDNFINAIFVDETNAIWIATSRSLDKFDPTTGRFLHFLNENDNNIRSLGFYIGAISQEDNNVLLLGGKGLYRFDKLSGTLSPYITTAAAPSIMNCLIGCLFRDSHNNLWIGTYGDGLYCVQSNKNIIRYTPENGLPHNHVQGLMQDNHGLLWIGTFAGLVSLDPSSGTITPFSIADKRMNNEFNAAVFHKGKSGRLYFGNLPGFVAFWPLSMKPNPYRPPVFITGMNILNEAVTFDRPISELDNIRLSYKQNMFSFEFVALNYTNSHKNRYMYKMDGFNEDWIDCGTERTAVFMNLNPGHYTFHVKGSNENGVWSEQNASVDVVIVPPFWKRLWFRIAFLAGIVVLIYVIVRYQLNKVRALERVRIQIASDLHDDIGSSLTKIAVHSEIIQTTTEKQKVSDSSQKIGDMSREIITTLSDIVWSIDARNDTIGDLVDRMRDFIETVFPAGDIQVDFQTKGLPYERKIKQTLRQNIYLIFKEAVNNAAKHASPSRISITLSNDHHRFQMNIQDNGPGINVNPNIKGHYGLANMKLRAARIGGEVTITNQEGTQVILTLKSLH